MTKTILILQKSSMKLMSSKCSRCVLLTRYLLCLVHMFFNRQSAFLWVSIFHLYVATFQQYIHIFRHSYKTLPIKQNI